MYDTASELYNDFLENILFNTMIQKVKNKELGSEFMTIELKIEGQDYNKLYN